MYRVCEIFACTYPIIQGAMGVICNPEFVAAVSEAGGFGTLATSFAHKVEILEQQIAATKKLTDKPFGVNLQVMNPLTPEFVDVIVKSGIKTVTISGGSPKALVPILKSKGLNAVTVVPSAAIAVKSEALGVDAVIAEGTESGGIQGHKGSSTMVLVPAVVDAVKIPVIAAGGIADSRGYKAALALGAEGVQVGTRFIASQECIAHAVYKETILAQSEVDTRLANLGPFRVRALDTPYIDKIQKDPSLFGKLGERGLEDSWVDGDLDAGMLPAGENVGLIHDIPAVADIIAEMLK